jgi:uncharacterized protein
MTPEERNLISSLFDRLRKADTAPKDPEAEAFIGQNVVQVPAAPYLLVQSLLVLEHAVTNAQARIADLEKQLAAAQQNQKASHGGGFLSGLFGGGRHEEQTPPPAPQGQPAAPRPAYAPPPQPQYAPPPPTPYPSTTNLQPGAGGSFLKGAMSTAAGVAGGALLFQGIENLIGHHAGPFGSELGAGGQGGFLPGDVQNTEVTNNYYVNEDPQNVQNAQDFDPGDQGGGVTDQNVDYNPGQDDNFDSVDDTFDDGGGDDTNFV